jgi:hypothetical protein
MTIKQAQTARNMPIYQDLSEYKVTIKAFIEFEITKTCKDIRTMGQRLHVEKLQ